MENFLFLSRGGGLKLRFDISSEEEDEIFIFRQKRKFSILFLFLFNELAKNVFWVKIRRDAEIRAHPRSAGKAALNLRVFDFPRFEVVDIAARWIRRNCCVAV